jgi:aspartyl aminopeptidase
VPDKKVKERVKMAVLEWLNKNYEITEEELLTADIRFVPAYKPKDVGFDRGLIASYGQDDRVCVFTGLKAFLTAQNRRTSILYLVDKEEVGSIGSTGAESMFLENVISRLIEQTGAKMSVYDFYRKSKGISADVTAAYDPDYKQAYDLNNVARLGHGMVIEKYLGHRGKSYTMEAEPFFIREIINIFNKKGVIWQTGHLGKAEQGGGGSIAGYLANRNMEVVDIGVALLNMHAPYELASKADVYSAFKGYKVFLEN